MLNDCIDDDETNSFNLRPQQYLKALISPIDEDKNKKSETEEDKQLKPEIPSHMTLLRYYQTLPLLDQIRYLMIDSKN